MVEFPIYWTLNPYPRENHCKLKLNVDWALVCRGDSCVSDRNSWNINSVEIRRERFSETIDDDYLITGELCFTVDSNAFKREFSQVITKGDSIAKIFCMDTIVHLKEQNFLIQGFVRMTAVSKKPAVIEKPATGSAIRESKEKIQLKLQEQLSNDFEKLLDPKASRLADVDLKCGGASIPAHKTILSARSPVFEKMFANPMMESRKNKVDIIDIDVTVLRALLIFVYTGKTPDLTAPSAKDLLYAANKYQLQDLKMVCSSFLMDSMSLQNVLQTLVQGDLHDEDLKSYAMDYICNKCADFSVLEKTEEWNTL